MKKNNTFMIFALVLFSTLGLRAWAQDAALQEKYWNYRHRLRTEFTKIGKLDGHSLPAENRGINKVCGNVPGKYQLGDATINLGEYIALLATEYKLLREDHQDLTAIANELYYALYALQRLDYYAEEYYDKPNKEDGFFVRDDWPKDMFRTINTNEVDKQGNLIANTKIDYRPLNGGLYHFQQAHREEGPIPSNDYLAEGVIKTKNQINPDYPDLIYTVKKGYGCEFARDGDQKPIEEKRYNEMSQDQVYGIIMGLYAVKKFVPADAGAAPRPTFDKYINFHNWVEIMADRILTFVSKKKTVKNAMVILNEDDEYRIDSLEALTTTWFIHNPSNEGKQVKRGMNMWMYAEPLARIGQEITGKSYSTEIIFHLPKAKDRATVLHNTSFIGFAENGCIAKQAQSAEKHKANGTEYKVIEKAGDCLIGGVAGAYLGLKTSTILFPVKLWMAATGDMKLPSAKEMWKIALWRAAQGSNNLGSQMTIKLAAMDPHFNRSSFSMPLTVKDKLIQFVSNQSSMLDIGDYYDDFTHLFPSSLRGKYFYNLLPNAFHPGNSKIISKDKQLGFLNSVPCQGIGKTANNQDTLDQIWMHGELLSLSKQAKDRDLLHREETVGMAFMLFYNLYRLVYKDQLTDVYRENTCPCTSTALVKHSEFVNGDYQSYEFDNKRPISQVGGTDPVITPRKYSDYADIGIPKPFYVSHDVEVVRGGELRVAGDFTLCGAELSVHHNGEVFIPNTDPNYPTHMRVENGGRLKLKTGSTLRIGNHSTLTIGEGGVLDLDRSAIIVLDGPNANLIIEGELYMREYAMLRIIPGNNGLGYVTFRKHKDPNTGVETLAKITPNGFNRIHLEGTSMHQKVLEIDGNFGVMVPENMVSFYVRDGKIELGKMSRLNVACPTTLENVRVHSINEDSTYYFAGLITQGQPRVALKNVHFRWGIYGVVAENYFYPHNKPNLEKCTFENMITAVQVDGGGIDMTNVLASHNSVNLNASGVNTDCVFEEVYLSDCRENLFVGSSSGVLNWYQGAIYRNNFDGVHVRGVTFKPKCLKIYDNARFGISNRGLGHLSLSALSDAGYNEIYRNGVGIYSHSYQGDLNGQGIGNGLGLDIHVGYNDFSANHNRALDVILNTASVTPYNGKYYLESSKNYWGKSTPPVLGSDYTTYWKPNWWSPLFQPEIETNNNHLTSSFQHLSSQAGICFQGMIVPNGEIDITDYSEVISGGIVTEGAFAGRGVGEVFGEGNIKLFGQQEYEEAMNAYQAILSANYSNVPHQEVIPWVYPTYKNYMMAYSKLLAKDSEENEEDYASKWPLIDRVESQITQLIADFSGSEEVSVPFLLTLHIDRAECYRSKDDRTTALRMYDEMLVNSLFENSSDLINAHRCVVEGEHRVLSGEITIAEKLEYYTCELPAEEYPTSIVYSEGGEQSSQTSYWDEYNEQSAIKVHPNPTDGLFSLSFDEEIQAQHADEVATVVIADGYGIPHFTFENVSVQDALSVNMIGYKAGVYHVKTWVGNSVYTRYVILTDQ